MDNAKTLEDLNNINIVTAALQEAVDEIKDQGELTLRAVDVDATDLAKYQPGSVIRFSLTKGKWDRIGVRVVGTKVVAILPPHCSNDTPHEVEGPDLSDPVYPKMLPGFLSMCLRRAR